MGLCNVLPGRCAAVYGVGKGSRAASLAMAIRLESRHGHSVCEVRLGGAAWIHGHLRGMIGQCPACLDHWRGHLHLVCEFNAQAPPPRHGHSLRLLQSMGECMAHESVNTAWAFAWADQAVGLQFAELAGTARRARLCSSHKSSPTQHGHVRGQTRRMRRSFQSWQKRLAEHGCVQDTGARQHGLGVR